MKAQTYTDRYVDFLSKYSVLVLIIVLLLFITGIYFLRNLTIEGIELQNILPEDTPVIQSMNILEDYYGGASFALIVITLEPKYLDSNEQRDIRNYEILKYQEIVEDYLKSYKEISRTTSSTDIIKSLNNGKIPAAYNDIVELIKDNPSFNSYISKDRRTSIIRVRLQDDCDELAVLEDLNKMVSEIPPVAGTSVEVGGSTFETPTVAKLVPKDMRRTTIYAIIGIIVALLLIMGSIRYSILPLVTVIIGIIWAMGTVGFLGIKLNNATSGVLSMILGIGIDFGIQITTRFRQENEKNGIEKSMKNTLNAVLFPMVITTLSALIGFWAMSLGTLTVLRDMGRIMSLGIVMCFIASVTAVPALIILFRRFYEKKQKGGKQNEKRNYFNKHVVG